MHERKMMVEASRSGGRLCEWVIYTRSVLDGEGRDRGRENQQKAKIEGGRTKSGR